MIKELNELATKIFEGNKEKGFWDDSPRDINDKKDVALKLMLIVSELGEAMEAHRKGRFAVYETNNLNDMMSFDEYFEKTTKDTFEDEIADTIIRLFDMCGGLNINIGHHIQQKLIYNGNRPKLHGKKY